MACRWLGRKGAPTTPREQAAFNAGIEAMRQIAMVAAVTLETREDGGDLQHRAAAAALPATGAIARTATNVNAGGRTPVAGMVHAVIVLLALLVTGRLAGALALPALAGLLIVTAWFMSEPHRWGRGWPCRGLIWRCYF